MFATLMKLMGIEAICRRRNTSKPTPGRKIYPYLLRGVRVALDFPTSWMLAGAPSHDFNNRMFAAVNAMMLDALAAVVRKDYEDRRRRQAQGQAKAEGKYRGRPEDAARNGGVAAQLRGRSVVVGHPSGHGLLASDNRQDHSAREKGGLRGQQKGCKGGAVAATLHHLRSASHRQSAITFYMDRISTQRQTYDKHVLASAKAWRIACRNQTPWL